MPQRARKGGGCLQSLISVILILVAIIAVLYFFFPDLSERYLGMSMRRPATSSADITQDLQGMFDDLYASLSSEMQRSGASREEIQKVFDQLDTGTLRAAAEDAMSSGSDAVGSFVESLDEKIDFGTLDTSVIKDALKRSVKDIDLSAATGLMREALSKGIGNLGDLFKRYVHE